MIYLKRKLEVVGQHSSRRYLNATWCALTAIEPERTSG
jgi:hypothetical protein